MSAHTPGDWQYGLPADGGRVNVYNDSTMSMRICRVDSDQDFGDHCKANARLIAAAPAMFEALDSLLDLALAHLNPKCPEIAKAQAAIAKATGAA